MVLSAGEIGIGFGLRAIPHTWRIALHSSDNSKIIFCFFCQRNFRWLRIAMVDPAQCRA